MEVWMMVFLADGINVERKMLLYCSSPTTFVAFPPKLFEKIPLGWLIPERFYRTHENTKNPPSLVVAEHPKVKKPEVINEKTSIQKICMRVVVMRGETRTKLHSAMQKKTRPPCPSASWLVVSLVSG
jgi:hypothetical protein